MLFRKDKAEMPSRDDALPGRDDPMPIREPHVVNDRPLDGPYPDGIRLAQFGLGCFWGAERAFWRLEGVWVTAVGYAAGFTPNPTYDEVCSGRTGHNEVVLVAHDPAIISYADLVRTFFESHDPTQGMRQGNDIGTQYRSGIYVYDDDQRNVAELARDVYQARLTAAGFGPITTEIVDAGPFYFAETYHQQYLARNPSGYCGLGGTGVTCPVGLTPD